MQSRLHKRPTDKELPKTLSVRELTPVEENAYQCAYGLRFHPSLIRCEQNSIYDQRNAQAGTEKHNIGTAPTRLKRVLV
jgi:hypothetical protein